MQPRAYTVRIDGDEGEIIRELTLEYHQYKTQAARDLVRRDLSEELHVPTHYLRLVPVIKGRRE